MYDLDILIQLELINVLTNVSEDEIIDKILEIKDQGEYDVRISYNNRVVTWLITNEHQIKWLNDVELHHLVERRLSR